MQHLSKINYFEMALQEITSSASDFECEFSQIQWKLRGVYKILWLSIARNKLNARLHWLSLCICCSGFPALISRMELALCTRGISQTMERWNRSTTLICACCLYVHFELSLKRSTVQLRCTLFLKVCYRSAVTCKMSWRHTVRARLCKECIRITWCFWKCLLPTTIRHSCQLHFGSIRRNTMGQYLLVKNTT